MNRAQRRKIAKKNKGQEMIINPGVEKTDRQGSTWCWLHTLNLDDVDHPTERDKKLIESTRFDIVKQEQRDGTVKRMKVCPRCTNTIILKDIVGGASVGGYTTK